MSLKAITDEATWKTVAQNDHVAMAVLRQAVLDIAVQLKAPERQKPQPQEAPIQWCEEA